MEVDKKNAPDLWVVQYFRDVSELEVKLVCGLIEGLLHVEVALDLILSWLEAEDSRSLVYSLLVSGDGGPDVMVYLVLSQLSWESDEAS